MVHERFVDIGDVGRVCLKKNSRARNLRITLKPFGGILVTVPGRMSYGRAERWIGQKKKWIQKNKIKIQFYENQRTIFERDTIFKTRFHQLDLVPENRINIRVRVRNGVVRIYYPFHMPVSDPYIQEGIRKGLEETWRLEAKKYIPSRVSALAELHGYTYNKISIRKSCTRWGSCSADNNISLSLYLMRLPEHLIEYVILHELVHTRHKNHSKAFWTTLGKMTGNAGQLDRELKKYRPDIY